MTDLIRPGQKVVHKLIAKTAKEIAAEVYEVLASNDRFYRTYPNVRRFVAKNWRHFIGDARKSLTVIMAAESPDGTPQHVVYLYPQIMRDEIFEALILEGEQKAPPPVDLNQLRRQAGFAPENYAKGHRPRLDA